MPSSALLRCGRKIRGSPSISSSSRQRVRILAHLLDCLLAIGLEDSHRPAGADAMAVQEKHDLADLLCLLPRMRDSLPALGADAIDRLQFGGSVFDHG